MVGLRGTRTGASPRRDNGIARHKLPARIEHEGHAMNTCDTIDRYCLAWSEPDPKIRAELLRSVWAANATYTDPTVHAGNLDELLDHIAKVQLNRPGAKVVRSTQLDEHHGIARFGFQVLHTNGSVLREGEDIAFFTRDGARIERIIGFFGTR
jgi:hypothetical protein